MDRARPEFEAAGVKLVLIGQGTPREAADFRRAQNLGLPVLADEQRQSYQAIGARKGGLGDLIGPKVLAKGAMNALTTGKLQTRTVGNTSQLGGAAVIAPGGEIVFKHLAHDAGDNIAPESLLAHAR